MPILRRDPASIACVLALAALFVPAAPAGAARPADADPLPGMLRRIERYLRKNEVDGVTMDWRYEVIPSEEIRQTVICQVLAYADLHELKPGPRLRTEIVEHADFLLGRLEEIRSHSPFDGMLACALWSAFEATGEDRFRAAALGVSEEMRAIPTEQCILNGGLMVAMGTAKEWQVTGNREAEQKTRDIVTQLQSYQNADGSFPHWCRGTRDIHYTGWMAMELIRIARIVDHPLIPTYLARMNAFLEGRIGPDGRAVYEGPCPGTPEPCTIRYWSRGSGCSIDYETRAWTVEPAYCALLFDHLGSPQYGPVVRFLDELEDGGTLADQYAYWPPPDDPYYAWTIADTSVVNASVIFWALTTATIDRAERGQAVDLRLAPDEPADKGARDPRFGSAGLPAGAGQLTVGPNPTRGTCRLGFALDSPGPVRLDLHDARGRRVRTLVRGPLDAGAHTVAWDGRDEAGRRAPRGLYFARLSTAAGHDERRLVLAP